MKYLATFSMEKAAAGFLNFSLDVGFALLSLSLLLVVVRIVRGPTLPDRIVGLDMLVTIGIGLIALFAINSGYALYIDIAIALSLVGFLATVAFARYILHHGADAERKGQLEMRKKTKGEHHA